MSTLKKVAATLTLTLFSCGVTLAGGSSPTLSDAQKLDAIDSLHSYEKEFAAQSPQAQLGLPKVAPFVCIDEHEQSCRMQEWLYNDRNRQAPAMFADGKYRVTITFQSKTPHPLKYIEKRGFESIPEAEQADAEHNIFEQHLGQSYSSFKPELVGASSEGATIDIWVSSSEDLLPFVDDPTIQGMHHLNNSALEEGYSESGHSVIRQDH